MNNNQPIAIGGLGGSGTRLFAQIMYIFNVYMGSNINDTDDNLYITFLFKRKEILDISKNEFNILFRIFEKKIFGIDLNKKERKIIKNIYNNKTKQDYLYDRNGTFRNILNETESENFTNWGWKEPNTHIILPFLLKRYPKIKYIHIMRNGLDMAFSKNKNQIKFWTNYKPTPKNILHYWTKIHKKVFKLQKKYPDNILIIDYDKFCLKPDKYIPKLLNFLNFKSNDDIISEIKSLIKIPSTMDRYKNYDIKQFNNEDLKFIKKLGYL